MMSRMFLYSSILLCGVFLSSVSQVMLKKAALKEYSNSVKAYLNPLVIFAYAVFGGTTLLSVLAYRGIPLSLGPIIESSGYIFVTFWGIKLFDEILTRKRIIGICLILFGIVLYSVS